MMLRNTTTAPLRWMGMAVVVALGLAGCGGSGSSGFDGTITNEPDAIQQATEGGTCVEFKGTTYCASGAPVMIGDDSAAVDFAESSEPVTCTQLPDDPGCTTSVGFAPMGFPETAVLLAAWAESERGPWTLSSIDPALPGSGGEGADDDDVVVILPDGGGGQPSPLVIAVLVYLEGVPADLPAVLLRLRGFNPDIVYLSSEVEVAPSTPVDALR